MDKASSGGAGGGCLTWALASSAQLVAGIVSYRKGYNGDSRFMPFKAFAVASLFVGAGATSVAGLLHFCGIHKVDDLKVAGANIRNRKKRLPSIHSPSYLDVQRAKTLNPPKLLDHFLHTRPLFTFPSQTSQRNSYKRFNLLRTLRVFNNRPIHHLQNLLFSHIPYKTLRRQIQPQQVHHHNSEAINITLLRNPTIHNILRIYIPHTPLHRNLLL